MNKPKVSVVIPSYNAEKRIGLAINSILNQTFDNWEMLVINEYTTNDKTADIVRQYAEKDPRIRLIQNTKKEGLAESINIGIREANGEYIARLDADDLAHPARLEKQVDYLDFNKDVGVLGTWQHHFGKSDWIHKPARKYDKCHAILLFDCNMCHSTVMMRKSLFDDVEYDKESTIEDFKLWTRLMRKTKIENIPEVLGEYYEGNENISNDKMDLINSEYPDIVGSSLAYFFDVSIPSQDRAIFQFKPSLLSPDDYLEKKMQSYIREIYFKNKETKFCNDAVMMHVLHYWWVREHTGDILFNKKIETYSSLEDLFVID